VSPSSLHDQMRAEGPRTAPEPETAEQRLRRIARRSAAPVAAGGAALVIKWVVTTAGAHAVARPGWWTVGVALLLFAAGLWYVGRDGGERA
jgi:hypothetical protein